jgi:hypothetical protein
MNAPVNNLRIDAVLVLRERAEARAILWREGYLDLYEAVDKLAADAARDGIRVDVAQAIMAQAFQAVRT